MSKIHPKGYWLSDKPDDSEATHAFDYKLARAIPKVLQGDSVVDFGCGPAEYLKVFVERGIECAGYDGNPNTEAMTGGLGSVKDLTEPFQLSERYDWVLSLEVGEHIPKELEAAFLDNIRKHANKGAIISWATPNQPGHGHVNCLSNKDVVSRFQSLGLVFDSSATRFLRSRAYLLWMKENLFVFRSRGPRLAQQVRFNYLTLLSEGYNVSARTWRFLKSIRHTS